MIDNFIYEINHYVTILNANRTYYLQRSQPTLLSAMILAYYDKTQVKKWLNPLTNHQKNSILTEHHLHT
ncbi:trehalase family glycosidase [Legionella pneumophila]|uniref:trehalase family glycosidase n=1 Tax=Legionella pneumophila TaxID=446 RepID=UPI00047FCDC7|nr:trehalase family glycosidase [Legionella pneumophila]